MQASRKFRVIVLGILLGSSAAAVADGPFAGVLTAANRAKYSGTGCPISIVYTATINLHPHNGLAFNYHWERSDGAKGATHVVRPGRDENSIVVRDTWRLGAPGQHYDVSETIHIKSGNTHEQFTTPVVDVTCR
jgi:hypothetical protein